jgi:hypothetical protein
MKFTCKECGEEFIRLIGHIKKKHGDIDEYLIKHHQYNIVKRYVEDKISTPHIAKEIRKFGLTAQKISILSFLKEKGVERRSNSEAQKNYIDWSGGVWNKGKTKEEHPSIKKYADSRLGKNNPFYTGTTEERRKEILQKFAERGRSPENIEKSKATIKLLRAEGLIKSFWKVATPEEKEVVRAKTMATRSQNCHKYRKTYVTTSTQEKFIGIVLDEFGIRYKKNFSLFYTDSEQNRRYYQYDYFLPDYNLVIEFNGSYWHCEPRKYDRDYYNAAKKKYAWEVWDRDEAKSKLVKQNEIRMETIWELDVLKMTNELYREYIIDFLKNKIGFPSKEG